MGDAWENLVSSTLLGAILIGDGSLVVQAGDGPLFPTIDRKAIIFGAAFATPFDDTTAEIVKITSVAGDTLSITRGQEGTAAKGWPNASKIWHILTAEELTSIIRKITQRAMLESTAPVTLSAIIPSDDTIPQLSEGTQIFSQAWTPKAAGNKIKVEVSLQISNTDSFLTTFLGLALFDGSTNALKARGKIIGPLVTDNFTCVFEFTAASTTPITISLRAGPNNATVSKLNISAGSLGLYGGKEYSVMEITEYTP